MATNSVAGMVDRFMDACEGGSMQGCYQAGIVYWTGEGVGKDIKAARSLLEISCDGGYDDACVALKKMKHSKQGDLSNAEAKEELDNFKVSSVDKEVNTDNQDSGLHSTETDISEIPAVDIKAYRDNCSKGEMESCYKVGCTYFYGYKVKKNFELARGFFDLACQGGVTGACAKLSTTYLGEKADFKKARKSANASCEKKVGLGCDILAFLYKEGKGVSKNLSLSKELTKKALRYYNKESNVDTGGKVNDYFGLMDIGISCTQIGFHIAHDKSAKHDYNKILNYYKKGCQFNNADACSRIATLYELGEKVKLDLKKSEEYYIRACNLGDSGDCFTLGMWYHFGESNIIKKNPEKAKKYYRKSCTFGNEDACDTVVE